jgi:hypothetical protein
MFRARLKHGVGRGEWTRMTEEEREVAVHYCLQGGDALFDRADQWVNKHKPDRDAPQARLEAELKRLRKGGAAVKRQLEELRRVRALIKRPRKQLPEVMDQVAEGLQPWDLETTDDERPSTPWSPQIPRQWTPEEEEEEEEAQRLHDQGRAGTKSPSKSLDTVRRLRGSADFSSV